MPIELSEVSPNFTLPDLPDQPCLRPERSPYGAGGRATTVSSHFRAVERVILVMRERLDRPLSLQAMAEIALLSPYHFNRVFRLITGVPPCKFLTVLRMEAAKRLLITTDLTVSDVCFGIGYNSLGSFSRDFTRLVGLSPTSLRRLVQTNSVPWAKRLGDYDANSRLSAASGLDLTGQIFAPAGLDGLIFVGLFTGAIPQGRPVRCALLSAAGPYHIAHVPDGTYHVFGAAFPRSDEPLAYLLPDQTEVHVGGSHERLHVDGGIVSGGAEVTLRPLRLTDPPILIALPLLMTEDLSAQEMVMC